MVFGFSVYDKSFLIQFCSLFFIRYLNKFMLNMQKELEEKATREFIHNGVKVVKTLFNVYKFLICTIQLIDY